MRDLRGLDLAVSAVLRDVGMRWSPHMDLRDLALRLGVAGVIISDRTAGADGRTVVDENEIYILLNSRSSHARRRFTLGHEIGHLVLADSQLRTAAFRRRTGLADPEHFCNAFASALLMPHWWIERNYADAPRRISTIRSLSSTAGTSWSAGILRLRQTLGWRESLISLRRETWGWRVERTIGLTRQLRSDLIVTPQASGVLEQLIGIAGAEQRQLMLATHGPLSRVTADITASGRTATAIASLGGGSLSERRQHVALSPESGHADPYYTGPSEHTAGYEPPRGRRQSLLEPKPLPGQISLFFPGQALGHSGVTNPSSQLFQIKHGPHLCGGANGVSTGRGTCEPPASPSRR